MWRIATNPTFPAVEGGNETWGRSSKGFES